MEKKYICVNDFQGSCFGMYRTYTAKEWGEQAMEWADSDGSEYADQWLLENFSKNYYINEKNEKKYNTEEDLINAIADMWEIQLEEVSIDNIEVVEYLLNELKDIKDNILNFYPFQEKCIKETALEIGLITAEVCPNCNVEVLINRNGEKCEHCGKFIKPCSLCDMDNVNCRDCDERWKVE